MSEKVSLYESPKSGIFKQRNINNNILGLCFDRRVLAKYVYLNLSLLGNFACCHLFLCVFFPKNYFRNTIEVSNGFDPDQARCFVEPELGPNCLQKSTADDLSRQIVKKLVCQVWLIMIQIDNLISTDGSRGVMSLNPVSPHISAIITRDYLISHVY